MPAKTALTAEQWLEKVKATLPEWFIKDADESVFRSHMKGMAAVFRAVEENLYQHIDETFIGRCSEDMLDVYASERLIPDLNYVGDARRLQVRDVRKRLHLEGIRRAVSELLDDDTVEVKDGYHDTGNAIIPADYNDAEEQVIDWDVLPNFFSVIVGEQILPSASFFDRGAYADRDAYAASSESGVSPVTERIVNVVNHYKASGTLYRIFQRS